MPFYDQQKLQAISLSMEAEWEHKSAKKFWMSSVATWSASIDHSITDGYAFL
jgi:hypothetical protein